MSGARNRARRDGKASAGQLSGGRRCGVNLSMMAASPLIGELRSSLSDESARIQREFETTGEGRACVSQRTHMVEAILGRLWHNAVSADESRTQNFALVATGGFGRGWLFPC